MGEKRRNVSKTLKMLLELLIGNYGLNLKSNSQADTPYPRKTPEKAHFRHLTTRYTEAAATCRTASSICQKQGGRTGSSVLPQNRRHNSRPIFCSPSHLTMEQLQ